VGTARVRFDRWSEGYSGRMECVRSSAVRDLFAAASRPDVISFAGGMPAVDRVPTKDVLAAAQEAICQGADTALQYGSSEGHPELRLLVVELMAEMGVRISTDDVILTAGAQQALDLLGKIFIDPGDVIIAEGPTYLGALQAFSAYEPDIRCVSMDDKGMRMDLLEEELEKLGPGKVKFIYSVPTFQNPTGVTMVPERRRRLLQLANEYQVPIIEDDPYSRLRFEGGHLKPLRSLDDDVIYVGTFSKIFAPGLRLGWLVAPHPILSKVLLAKQSADLCGSAFAQLIAVEYFRGKRWRKTLRDLTSIYKERRDAMLEALEEHFPPEAQWTHPEGGLFVWVTLPRFVDSKSMLAEALDYGVAFVPGDAFFPDGRGRNSMRLNFSFPEPDEIREGIRRLAAALEDRLELYRAFIRAGAIETDEADGSTRADVEEEVSV